MDNIPRDQLHHKSLMADGDSNFLKPNFSKNESSQKEDCPHDDFSVNNYHIVIVIIIESLKEIMEWLVIREILHIKLIHDLYISYFTINAVYSMWSSVFLPLVIKSL